MYEIVPHTADIGLRITAPNLDALLSEAGRAFYSVIVANLDAVEPRSSIEFRIDGRDPAYLLADWLNELLFVFETKQLLLCTFEVKVNSDGIQATARGETYEEGRHLLDHEVKAVTYHGLRVEPVNGEWIAEVILDI
jgi:SHS2 domain-containing protein